MVWVPEMGAVNKRQALLAAGVTEWSKRIYHEGVNHTESIKTKKIPGIYMMEVIKPDNTKQTNKVIIN